jgi:ABC-type transporter Mla MlaB component
MFRAADLVILVNKPPALATLSFPSTDEEKRFPMSDSPATKRVVSHQWDVEAKCLTLRDPLVCDEPAENVSAVFAEHYGHSLGPDVTMMIDVSEVEHFDTSGIAFLVMFRHRLMDSDTGVGLIGPSPKLQGVLELLGLGSEFGIPQTADVNP